MANTVIQLKYSSANTKPATLNVAEPAYSNSSGVLWIGDGTNVWAIGGKSYTDRVDAATDSGTANTIVKRDTSDNFAASVITATLYGKANTADAWQTARNIGVNGDASGIISVDGTANANIPLVLATTGVSTGTYGGTSNIPVLTVDAKGRVTYAANVSISTSLNFAGDSTSGSLALASDTLTIKGGLNGGITANAVDANNTVLVSVDNTVIRTSSSGTQSISGDLAVTGNLTVTGTQTVVNTTVVQTNDSLIKLANNNTSSDVLDIGFYGSANTNTAASNSTYYFGLVRQAGGNFFLFKNVSSDPTSNTLASGSATASNTATLRANITGGMVYALANTISVVDGGTGAATFSTGAILVGDGTNSLKTLANTGTAGTYGSSSYVPIVTTDTYGRVSGVSNTAISIGTSAIGSGILGIARGGTNNDTYTTGQRVIYDGGKLTTQANTGSPTVTGALSVANTITSITLNNYGEVTAYTGSAIAIDTSQVTSGTLGVARGGTGAASFSTTGVIISGATSTSALSALTSATEGHVLQINSSGAPTFAHLNGGTF